VAAHESEETFLTVAEVAATLKLNQQTVRNWIDDGRLPALRVGRRVRIKQSDFDRIIREGYSGPPPEAETGAGAAAEFWGGGAVGVVEAGPVERAEDGTGVEVGARPASPGDQSPRP